MQVFSKTAFISGAYDDVDLSAVNTSRASGYALTMALQSKRMPDAQLRRLVDVHATD